MKKILIAPDKFKGTLSAAHAAHTISEIFRRTLPDAEIIEIPLADGGEGTVSVLTAALKGTFIRKKVHGPLGAPVEAEYGLSGKTAIMEMAAASGMALLQKEQLNPLFASTYGTGELILDALEHGVSEIILGIGGSATVDGGCGMAEALGCKFFDTNGLQIENLCGGNLSHIAKIDPEAMNSLLKDIRIRIAADVKNPLLGPEGTVAVYAPQKGATAEMMPVLESGLSNLLEVLHAQDLPGDGAAGGIGFGLRVFCHAKTESGAKLVMRLSGFCDALKGADLVVTGEGCTDAQTEEGKICGEIACAAKESGVPCILLSGGLKAPRTELHRNFPAVLTSGIGRETLEETLSHAEEDLAAAAKSAAFLLAFKL